MDNDSVACHGVVVALFWQRQVRWQAATLYQQEEMTK